MTKTQELPVPPDGIDDGHVRPIRGWRRHASPLSVVVFGLVLVLGLTGVLGHERTWSAEANDVVLSVDSPETIRNGEFLEMRIGVESSRRIGELVIGIRRSLWEDMTVNTMIPAATDEESVDGEFRFTFGPLEPGGEFMLKADLQVNPDIVAGNAGTITVYDGDEPIVDTAIEIRVLP